MAAELVIVNGIPGTGKSTLAAKLKTDLGIPLMGKDMLKEFFFDTLGVNGRDQSRMIGKASSEMLYTLANYYVAGGCSLIVESAFFAEFARPEFMRILVAHPTPTLEIYCQTDAKERRKRFRKRFESGNRHQGHQDGTDMAVLTEEDTEPFDIYPPLGITETITIDTTNFGDKEYAELLKQVKAYFEGYKTIK